MKKKELSCEEFQKQLPEAIAVGMDARRHSHALKCELCSALVHDLEMIAQAAARGHFFGTEEQ